MQHPADRVDGPPQVVGVLLQECRASPPRSPQVKRMRRCAGAGDLAPQGPVTVWLRADQRVMPPWLDTFLVTGDSARTSVRRKFCPRSWRTDR